jgi:hypothetical protein
MKTFAIILLILFIKIIYPSDYYPLSTGNKWVYNQYDGAGRFVGVDSQYISNDTIIGGTHYYMEHYLAKWSPGDTSNDFLYSRGDTIFMTDSSRALKAIAAYHAYYNGGLINLQLGGIDTVKYIGTITVLAGTFDSCYFVPWSRTTGLYMAPNVGLIKEVSRNSDGTIGSTEIELNWFEVMPECLEQNNKSQVSTSLKAIPNPSSFKIHFLLGKEANQPLSLKIYDIKGSLIYQRQEPFYSFNCLSLDISHYRPGIYLCNVNQGNYTYNTQFIVCK